MFKKYSQRFKEREKILFDIKESASSPYKWQQKTFIERLSLVPQYLLAYYLVFEIYVIHYTAVRFFGIPYIVITLFGLFGDGKTTTQLVCLVFTFWAVTGAVGLRFFLANPKRLQWFYDMVGEKRVRPMLFSASVAVKLLTRTVPVVSTILGLDTAGDMLLQNQFDADRRASHLAANTAHEAALNAAQLRCKSTLEIVETPKERNKAFAALDKEIDAENKRFDKLCNVINNRVRETETPFNKVLQSDAARHMVNAVEKTTNTVLGSVLGDFWKK